MRGCSPLPVVPRALRMRRRPPRNGRRVWLCRFGAFSLYAEERSATLGAWVLQRTNISRENCNRGSATRCTAPPRKDLLATHSPLFLEVRGLFGMASSDSGHALCTPTRVCAAS